MFFCRIRRVCFYFCFMQKRTRGSLIIKPNVATWFIMRWNSFSEDLEPEKLFRLDCRLPPLVTVQAHDLNVHLQNAHARLGCKSASRLCSTVSPNSSSALLGLMCEIWRRPVAVKWSAGTTTPSLTPTARCSCGSVCLLQPLRLSHLNILEVFIFYYNKYKKSMHALQYKHYKKDITHYKKWQLCQLCNYVANQNVSCHQLLLVSC